MSAWIAVAVGGALGSVARHGVNRWVHHEWPLFRFPAATLVVNVVGCALIGILAALVATERLPMRASWRQFVFVGILGGFTTFSTFGLDTMTLVRSGAMSDALLNIALHVVIGLGMVYASYVGVERLVSTIR
jgi:CrcB protein